MRCKNIRIMISAGFDGELSESERIAVESHVSSCASCAREKARLSAVTSVMRKWEDAEPSPWLAQSFAYRLCEAGNESQVVRSKQSAWLIGSAAGGLITAALAFLLMFNSQFTPRNTLDTSRVSDQSVTAPPAAVTPSQDTQVAESQAMVEAPAAPEAVMNSVQPEKPATARHRRVRAFSVPRVRHSRTIKPVAARLVFHYRLTSQVSRGLSNGEERAQERAKELIIEKLMKMAKTPKGDAGTVVVGNLDAAGAAIDGTLERVRGALRKAADVLSESATRSEENRDANGGAGL
jgi:hypothetical protein